MSDIIAILGVIGTFTIPILVFVLEKSNETKPYILISKNRRRKLNGEWSGIFTQTPYGDMKNGETILKLTLKVGRKKVTGVGIITDGDYPELRKMNFKGGFRNDRFLSLAYSNDDMLQFGTVLFELKPTNDVLVGKFLGYGPFTEAIVYGDGKFIKTKVEMQQ